MDIEQWRPIPGYEGRYEVSSHGRVRSLPFQVRNRWGPMVRGGKLRTLKPNERGYLTVELSDGLSRPAKKVRVHRLVLLAFVGEPPPDKPNGLHEDDDRSNNHVDNLYWGDQSENATDCVDNGHNFNDNKATCPLGHSLTKPNLVKWQADQDRRSCLACSLAVNNHLQDERLRKREGRERTRYNRSWDGFLRRRGESWQDEAHRRYAHIMRTRPHDGLA
jgi:hypothetical protein